jgi:hypothetical protein
LTVLRTRPKREHLAQLDRDRDDRRSANGTRANCTLSNQSLTPAECVFSFRVMKLHDQIEQLKSELAEAERAEDSERVAALSNEYMLLSQRRQKALIPISEAHQTEI